MRHTTDAIPRNHQLPGINLYSLNPGSRITESAAATGLMSKAFSTVLWPNGASRPYQISSGVPHTASNAA